MKHHPFRTSVTLLAAVASLAAYFFIASAATAARSQWVTSQGGDIRIVAGRPKPDGAIPAILDIRLKPGWKTYWLEPGASGIPPQITIDPATGVVFSGMRFPPPKNFDDGIVRYTGYDRPVAFPLLLKTDRPRAAQIKASFFLGICKDICIPVQGDLAFEANDVENPLDEARIKDAFAALPAQPSEGFRVKTASLDQAAKTLRLSMVAPSASPETPPEIFLAGPPGFSFGKPRKLAAEAGTYLLEVPFRAPAKGGNLKSGAIFLVARSGGQSMETPLAFD
ncbi:protein-disulfide reductase DsbD domain-containing protein [Pararhizobium gei]|uniref:protein-disulfide reductase DsbD domain-containing protein n=1 Tax=Pararhizobium gei TaxID=1395951 RepID=UPI0023DC99D9|nr:protein-disulfide reductase DsbD domain-containing protein [Rhizobium gei]